MRNFLAGVITNLVTETAEIWEEAGSLLSTTDRPVRTGSAKLHNKGGIEQEKRTQFPAGGIGRGAGRTVAEGTLGANHASRTLESGGPFRLRDLEAYVPHIRP